MEILQRMKPLVTLLVSTMTCRIGVWLSCVGKCASLSSSNSHVPRTTGHEKLSLFLSVALLLVRA